jgi:hypothetical protein
MDAAQGTATDAISTEARAAAIALTRTGVAVRGSKVPLTPVPNLKRCRRSNSLLSPRPAMAPLALVQNTDLHHLPSGYRGITYACSRCSETLALHDELVSKAFNGRSGRA